MVIFISLPVFDLWSHFAYCVAVQNDLGSLFLVPNVEDDHINYFR